LEVCEEVKGVVNGKEKGRVALGLAIPERHIYLLSRFKKAIRLPLADLVMLAMQHVKLLRPSGQGWAALRVETVPSIGCLGEEENLTTR
jgi:hypothetical protein